MLRRALVLAAVAVAALVGAFAALAVVQTESTLSVGTVRLDVDPGHDGALDIYAPLVDWGVRFGGVRLPVRLKVDVRAVNRDAVVRIAQAGELNVKLVREEATEAVKRFLVTLLVATLLGGFALGALVALALRPYSAAATAALPARRRRDRPRRDRGSSACCCRPRSARTRSPGTTRTGPTSRVRSRRSRRCA